MTSQSRKPKTIACSDEAPPSNVLIQHSQLIRLTMNENNGRESVELQVSEAICKLVSLHDNICLFIGIFNYLRTWCSWLRRGKSNQESCEYGDSNGVRVRVRAWTRVRVRVTVFS